MSFHVYIARSGFENTPIDGAEWLAAARQCPDLLVTEEPDRTGDMQHSVHLLGNTRKTLSRTAFGLICARDPNRELIVAMFQLAEKLNARLYSEHMKPYVSVQDWERRTREYRAHREKHVRARRSGQRVRKTLSALLGGAAIVFVAWIFGSDDMLPTRAPLSNESLASELQKGEPLTLESLKSLRGESSDSAPAASTSSSSSPVETSAAGKP